MSTGEISAPTCTPLISLINSPYTVWRRFYVAVENFLASVSIFLCLQTCRFNSINETPGGFLGKVRFRNVLCVCVQEEEIFLCASNSCGRIFSGTFTSFDSHGHGLSGISSHLEAKINSLPYLCQGQVQGHAAHSRDSNLNQQLSQSQAACDATVSYFYYYYGISAPDLFGMWPCWRPCDNWAGLQHNPSWSWVQENMGRISALTWTRCQMVEKIWPLAKSKEMSLVLKNTKTWDQHYTTLWTARAKKKNSYCSKLLLSMWPNL